jgi:hypothetical protein
MKALAIPLVFGTGVTIGFLLIALFAGAYVSESIWYVVSLPGAKLKSLADSMLTPSGAAFLLRSDRQMAHHLLMALCIVIVWLPVFTVISWWFRRDHDPQP